MTKADIVAEISKSTGIEKVAIEKIVEALMENIKTNLAQDKHIFLMGFGRFLVKKRARKTARNISKNTIVIIPEHYAPAFRPVKEFLNRVKKIKK